MANILAKYSTANVDAGLVALYSTVTFGTTSITSQDSHKMTISRTGVGLYKATLVGPFNALFDFSGVMVKSSISGLLFEVISTASVNSAADPSFTFRSYVSNTGVAGEPVNTDVAMFKAVLRNSAQFRKGG